MDRYWWVRPWLYQETGNYSFAKVGSRELCDFDQTLNLNRKLPVVQRDYLMLRPASATGCPCCVSSALFARSADIGTSFAASFEDAATLACFMLLGRHENVFCDGAPEAPLSHPAGARAPKAQLRHP